MVPIFKVADFKEPVIKAIFVLTKRETIRLHFVTSVLCYIVVLMVRLAAKSKMMVYGEMY